VRTRCGTCLIGPRCVEPRAGQYRCNLLYTVGFILLAAFFFQRRDVTRT
jgi:hypothetical protein